MSDGKRQGGRAMRGRVLGGKAAGPAIESQALRGKQRGRRSNYMFSNIFGLSD